MTNKFKEEFKNTVSYYENFIDNLTKENNDLKKHINLHDEDNLAENYNNNLSEEEKPEKN